MSTVQASQNLTAVIVEDSPTQAISIRQRVQRCGFSVRWAANGEAAIDFVKQQVPTVVLTDLDMPVMNGLQLTEQLSREFPGLPIVLMTADGSEEIAVQALRAGAANYVPKQKLDHDLPRVLEDVLAIVRVSKGQYSVGQFLTETASHFWLPNDISLIPPLVSRLQKNLERKNVFSAGELMRIGIALREALMNAIEHGNLELSSALREEDDDAYRNLADERRRHDPFCNRRVRVCATESRIGVTFVIADEGPGFDPKSLPDPTAPENLEKASGRGLLLIRSFMDEVTHNAAGNEITLVKFADG
jgi:CheY-like chemotaxis protein